MYHSPRMEFYIPTENIHLAYFKILRHGSLQMNVINMLVKFQSDKRHIKQEIFDQKLKVKK